MKPYAPENPDTWQGRVDTEETRPALRWHQKMTCIDLNQKQSITDRQSTKASLALLGFQSDAGVKRNKGRPGAAAGPNALRTALTNMACKDQPIFDAGNVQCLNDDLESAQAELAKRIDQLIQAQINPIVLGGGHEVAWASFQGLIPTLLAKNLALGIINFDAHLDLRAPNPLGSSGTPFRQICEWCEIQKHPFHYAVVGVNPSANTQALFEYAKEKGVSWIEDTQFEAQSLEANLKFLDDYLNQVDALYITICLDVFNAAFAPGVSAPAAIGINPAKMLALFQQLLSLAKRKNKPILLLDVAELSPAYDKDNITAKLGARLVWEYHQSLP